MLKQQNPSRRMSFVKKIIFFNILKKIKVITKPNSQSRQEVKVKLHFPFKKKIALKVDNIISFVIYYQKLWHSMQSGTKKHISLLVHKGTKKLLVESRGDSKNRILIFGKV